MNQLNHYRRRTQLFFYVLFAGVAYLSYLVFQPYFTVIVLAFIVVLFFKPVYDFLYKVLKKRAGLASTLSTIIVLLAIVIPLAIVFRIVYLQTDIFIQDAKEAVELIGEFNLEKIVEDIETFVTSLTGINIQLDLDQFILQLQNSLSSFGNNIARSVFRIGANSLNILTSTLLFILLVASLFPLASKMSNAIEKVSPLDDGIDRIYFTRVVAMSKAMVKGTFVIAATQALISCIFMFIVGVPYLVFWFMIMTVIGILPIVGTILVVFPIAIFLIVQGNVGAGIFLIATNLIITSQIDNIMRPMLVPKSAELHPALTMIGVLGGLKVFGVLGFIYGPVIMILLVTSVQIYLEYYQNPVAEGVSKSKAGEIKDIAEAKVSAENSPSSSKAKKKGKGAKGKSKSK